MSETRLRPRRRGRRVDVNLTPLIDVVFLLLIFFMVSTTFNRYSDIKVALPEGGAETQERQPKAVEIEIDAQGNYYLNHEELVNRSRETLERALRRAHRKGTPPRVVIAADARTPHQAVVTAMDAAGRVGLNEILFATSSKAE